MLITLTLLLSERRAARQRDAGLKRRSAGAARPPLPLAGEGWGEGCAEGRAPRIDREQILADARRRFLRLQAAWDARDLGLLRSLTTPELFEDLRHVLAACEASASTRTDVITLHARLLGLEEVGAAWLASIEFSGWIRESAETGAVPFRELWMLAADKNDEPSWRLARQQALL